MEIIYDNSNIQNLKYICKKELTKTKYRGIYTSTIANRNYIVKKNDNTMEATVTREIIERIKSENIREKYLFVNIRSIIKCDHEYLYIMDNICMPELRFIMPILNNQWRIRFLLQSLVSIYLLNHTIGYYHNDLYFKGNVRNIMVDCYYPKDKTDWGCVFYGLTIPTDKYYIRMIDYGWSSKEPGKRTSEYHEKYFPEISYVSEVLLFSYIYFYNSNPKISENIKSAAIKIMYDTSDRKSFDRRIIKLIYSSYNKYL